MDGWDNVHSPVNSFVICLTVSSEIYSLHSAVLSVAAARFLSGKKASCHARAALGPSNATLLVGLFG